MARYFITIIILLHSFCTWTQVKRSYDSISIKSTILKKDKTFAIYLPKGYDTSKHKYPVLYLLHGVQGNQTDWLRKGELERIADIETENGNATPMIIVMPDAEATYYMNNVDGKYQFEDFIFYELIPYVEKNYRCHAEKKYRAIAGLSMGGFGALLYSLHHPEFFSSCAALSAAVRTDEEIKEMPHTEYIRRYRSSMGELNEGDNRITHFWNQNSILYLVKNIPEDHIRTVRFYLDIGDDDFLYTGNSLLHILMRDRKIPHEFRVRNGGHNWEYWKTGLPAVLAFVSESFR